MVPHFRKIITIWSANAWRMVNKDCANAVQDMPVNMVLRPASFQLTEEDIKCLAGRLQLVDVQLDVLRVKTTQRDVIQACDLDIMHVLLQAVYPFTTSMTHIIIKSIYNLHIFLPDLLTHSNRLTHLNISSHCSTLEMWNLLPDTLRSLRCSLIIGPTSGSKKLPHLQAFSDHSFRNENNNLVTAGVIRGIMEIAPQLQKFVRKEPVFFNVTHDTLIEDIIYIEQVIDNGLCTDHSGNQEYTVRLSLAEVMAPFLTQLALTHPMMLTSLVVVSDLNKFPDRTAIKNKIVIAFPNASIKIER